MSAPRWEVRQHPQYGHWCVFRQHDSGTSSISCKSEEEAKAKLAAFAAVGTCRECADVLNDGYMEPYKTQIRERQLCFSCLFWQEYIDATGDSRHVVVKGYHYGILPDRQKSLGSLGHGGARFEIRFHDGREVVTHNLWAHGRIPDHFRDRLPDNAVFVQRGHKSVGAGGGYVGVGSADAFVEQP